mmetsp:Transcript_17054/g.41274  ORF Transcript_17054/g.41274 Transcript_17054/m.41274 type:complete len:140 (+) Transcript_17054:178-597(+)
MMKIANTLVVCFLLAMAVLSEGSGDSVLQHSRHRAAMKKSAGVLSGPPPPVAPGTAVHTIAAEKIAKDDAEDHYIDLPAWALGERSRGDTFAGSMTMLGAAMLCLLIAAVAFAVLRVRAHRYRPETPKSSFYSSGGNGV